MSHDTVYDPKNPNMVYLRPNPGARPLKYEQSVAMQGMMLDRKHAIAIYTSRAGMAVGPAGATGPTGPAGPAGDPAPAAYDTIIASCSDEETPLTVDLVTPKTTFRAPYPFDMTNGYVRISLTTAPLVSHLMVDLKMNGTSIFATKVRIDASETTSVTSAVPPVYNFPGNLVPDDAEFTVFVTAIGSGFAGAGLKIALTGQKVV